MCRSTWVAVVSSAFLVPGITVGQEVHCGSHEKIATTPTVTAHSSSGLLGMKREEKVALAFMASIAGIEFWCVQQEQHPCTLDQMTSSDRTAAGSPVGCLTYDPTGDANYTFSVTIKDESWDARASAKTKSLMSFHFKSSGNPYSPGTFYKPPGVVGPVEKELGYEATGESFELP
jgi:hypothetical protein